MNIWIILFAVSMVSGPIVLDQAYAQTVIEVGETEPCFMNYTAGANMWKNCNFQGDPVGAAMLGFEWVTGGLFSMIIVALIVIMVYIKYHQILYPIAIGIIMIPRLISYSQICSYHTHLSWLELELPLQSIR